jgi:GT2 family glycosyltransferase
VTEPLVSAIVLNYNAAPDLLDRCLASLRGQTYPRLELLLVDNASPDRGFARVAAAHPGVRVVALPRNLGFSGGMNRGVEAAAGEAVLLLNYDVELDPGAVDEMVRVLRAGDRVAGVAPKTVFMHDRHVIDNVGTLIHATAAAFNMGIGQLDLGQYDVGEEVFGACFAAALFPRAAFAPEAVGPLDERYFMYYEDVDWCYRANLLGWRFLTAPRARVAHVHSASVRHLDYGFKFRLIERNLLYTVLKNFETRRAGRILVRRSLAHLRKVARRGAFWAVGLKLVAEFWRTAPRFLADRRRLQARRQVSDNRIFRHAWGEAPYYDPVNYAPTYHLDTLEAIYRRRHAVQADRESGEIAAFLGALRHSKVRFEQETCRRLVRERLAGQPAFVRDFVDRIEY